MFLIKSFRILILILFSNIFLLSCSKRAPNWPVDGSHIGEREKYTDKFYPYKNIPGLESEESNQINYDILNKTEDTKFNLDKDITVNYLDNYYEIISDYENSLLPKSQSTLDTKEEEIKDVYNLDRFKNTSYILGNGKILTNLRNHFNYISIPNYINDYFINLKKYIQIKDNKKQQNSQEVPVHKKGYWQNVYHLNNSKQRFHEKNFNYYRYLKNTFGD